MMMHVQGTNAFVPQHSPELPKIEYASENSVELLVVQIQAAYPGSLQFHAHWAVGIVEGEADYLISAPFEFQSEVDTDSFRSTELIRE
jgi:hypothetical protein